MNAHIFDLHDARQKIEAWRQDYNAVRPHQSLGNPTPEEYVASLASDSPLRGSSPATPAGYNTVSCPKRPALAQKARFRGVRC